MDGLKWTYFILNPSSSDDQFALASREAILTFAENIKTTNSQFATSLCEWVEHLDLNDNREGK